MTNFEELYCIKTLSDFPEKLPETITLIEKSFNYSNDQSFKIDFLPLMNEKNLKNCHLLIEKASDQVIGHIGICPRNIHLDQKEHACALLGGICLDENFRGKKIFKKFFEIVLLSIESQFSFMILWSGEPELYLKNSFHLAIDQVSYALNVFEQSDHYVKVDELDEEQKRGIKECFNKHIKENFQSLTRTQSDWNNIFQMTSVEFWLNQKDSNIISYFFRSKGQDLNGIIHELAIDSLKNFKPPFKEGFLWYPEKNDGFKYETHFGAIVKLSNLELLNKYLSDHLNSRLLIQSFDKENVHFVFEGNNFHYPINEFICGLWGPGQFEELNEVIKPFYIPGVDSI